MSDPRFDPAFQRGYSGPDPELVVRGPVAESEPPRASVSHAAKVADGSAELPASAPTSEPQQQPKPELSRGPASRFAIHNPARFALLLLGVALLLATLASLYWQVLHPQASSTTADSQFVQLLVSNLPPVLGLAGWVCLILWLALGALDRAIPDAEPAADVDAGTGASPDPTIRSTD